ncbi:hypothetical protein ACTVZO_40815 [Streptomyces sp. IBSNAI002]|uniref:hypothetical protein n=1 Tax=Streptomyces sp. IBSNAI002 TaxID=3457500 RepID=UPI003FD1E79E
MALYGATLFIGVASTMLSVKLRRAREHLVRADSVADTIQRTVLRAPPRRLGPVTAAAFYTAGEGGTLVGGDLYDACVTPFGVRAIIGDVRGKGLDAVQTVTVRFPRDAGMGDRGSDGSHERNPDDVRTEEVSVGVA